MVKFIKDLAINGKSRSNYARQKIKTAVMIYCKKTITSNILSENKFLIYF